MADQTSDSFLKEMRESYDYSEAEWTPHRQEGAEDMKIIAGDHWPPEERAARRLAGTLCVDFDEINQHTNQMIGQQQMNEVGIGVLPEGSGSNDETAELEEEAIRSIEYESKANQARMWALTAAIHRGYGFTILRKRNVVGTFRKQLVIKAVQNPDTVTFDGRSKEIDGSDAMCGWITNRMAKHEFLKIFGKKAKITNFSSVNYRVNGNWIGPDDVQVAEYYKKTLKRSKLLQIRTLQPNPQTRQMEPIVEERYEKDLKADLVVFDGPNVYVPDERRGGYQQVGTILDDRWDEVPDVKMYWTNGLEILRPDDQEDYDVQWDGSWVPITPYYCNILYIDQGGFSKRVLESAHRRARGPQMAFSYCKTATLIAVGNQSKSPYRMYEGQDENHPEWANVNSVNYPFMVVKAHTAEVQDEVLPLPSRDTYTPEIQASEAAAESYRRSIQAAIGASPLPTQAQRQNEKSGVALESIRETSAVGTYGVVDHYHASIEHEGRMIEELLPSLIPKEQDMRLRKKDGTYHQKRIDPKTFTPKHATTIRVQPAAQSQREAVERFGDNLAANNPEVFARIGWLLIQMRNMGPLGDKMAELLKPADQKAADGDQDPAALAQKLGEMQQELQKRETYIAELDKKLVEFESGLKAKDLEGKYKVELQGMQDSLERWKTDQVEATKRWIAGLNSKTTLTLPAINHKLKVDEIAEVHEDTMEEIDAEAEIQDDQAETAHERALEQGDVAHEHTTEQMETAAKLAPEPKKSK